MSVAAKKVRAEIQEFVDKVEAKRNEPKRAKKKKWANLTDPEKDALLKQLVLEAGLLDES